MHFVGYIAPVGVTDWQCVTFIIILLQHTTHVIHDWLNNKFILEKTLCSDNSIITTFASMNKNNVTVILAKYGISSVHDIKCHMWMHFVRNECDRNKIKFF